MRKETLYSSSSRSKHPAVPATPVEAAPAPRTSLRQRKLLKPQMSWLFAIGLLVALALSVRASLAPPPRALTQADVDAAVLHTLEKATLPSQAAKAAEVIRPSVVRVRGMGKQPHKDLGNTGVTTGSGVVVVETGLILTSLHVVVGAEQIEVTFADGLRSEAHIVGAQPQNDLAVLQASKLPDDLVPATLRSTQNLAPGETVVAVGFPFGIGPSVSSGVISGLKREYQSPEGNTLLTNLIQFDAAANPGSSGGPLVTADGEVIGIVTAILNPSEQRVFIGIGFAVPIENAAAAVGQTPF
jgi:S1-C subfamily serine protease